MAGDAEHVTRVLHGRGKGLRLEGTMAEGGTGSGHSSFSST